MADWSSLHMYVHGDRASKDDFLLEHIAPAADRMVADGAATAWFFVRYWEGGPHIRVRFRDAEPSRVTEFADDARTWLAKNSPAGAVPAPETYYTAVGGPNALTDYGWHQHGTVVEAEYEPELTRYGGAAAMDAAEDLFVASTRVAVAAVRASRDGTRRLGVAFNLLVAFAASVCENTAVEVTMLRRYVLSSRYNTVDAPRTDMVALREQAEADFAADGARYRAAAAKVRTALAADDAGSGLLATWARHAAAYAERLRELGSPQTYWTVLLSQLHMLNNRMGVELAEEYRLSWLASLAAAGTTLGDGFHDRGLETSARRYHEESKYFAGTVAGQLPREAAHRPPSQPQSSDIFLTDPAELGGLGGLSGATGNTGLADRSLIDCLAARRSTLGPLCGDLDLSLDQLSALLGHAARESELVATLPDDRTLTSRARPYPSAGACLPTRIMVLPSRVEGLPPAVYEYLPDRHVLRPTAPAPTAAALGRTSPYLDASQPVALDPETVPLWLFVVGDISALTQRYGLRAYRFLLLEAGHLTQNLTLVATALNLASTTIGAFYDDALSQLLELDGVNAAPFYVIPVGHG